MGQRRYIDFDSMFKENERKPIIAKIKGEEFIFPAQMPAKTMFKIQRMEEKGVDAQKSLDSKTVLDLYGSMLGHDNFQKLLDLNATMQELEMVLEGVMQMYGAEEMPAEEPKKAEAAEVVQIPQTAEKETEFRL